MTETGRCDKLKRNVTGESMTDSEKVIISDPDILGGEPVFRSTRVPFQAMIDYLQAGERLDDFLADFPTVTREAAIEAIEEAKSLLLAHLG
jgi:uncharacterized protein (DUF433 family)